MAKQLKMFGNGLDPLQFANELDDDAEDEERKAKHWGMWNRNVSIPNTGHVHVGAARHASMAAELRRTATQLRAYATREAQ